MREPNQEIPLCQAFECLRYISADAGDMFPVAAHTHYFSEILLVRSGACRVTRKGITHLLNAGELIYIAPMIRHSVESADGAPARHRRGRRPGPPPDPDERRGGPQLSPGQYH